MKTTTIKIATFILMTVFMSFKTTLWAVEVEPSVTLTTYYSAANGKSSDALRTALQGIISSHTTVSYDNLSYLMVYADTEDADGSTLIDIYSSCPVTISGDRITWSSGTSTVGLGLNREHTVPQSWFSEGAPMKSDAFHVYPVDAKANGNRSDNLYGEFSGSGTQYKSETCSESGKLSASASHSITAYTYQGTTYSPTATYTGKVYEPDDEYKGDIARGYFYMATCYASACSSWSGGAFGSDNNGLANYTAEIMLKWHRQDPVSEKELLRNEVIYGNSTYNKSMYKQGNRNPFIDYPELVEYIWGNKKGQNVSISNLVSGYDGTCSGQLSQPTVTATAGDEQITLTWADVSGADHYTVSIGTGVGYTTECSSPSIGTITHSGTTNTCVITGLINGLAYTTSVVANGVSSICDSDADEDIVTPTAELPTTVTVTFDANGGTGTMSDQVIDYNTATALTENAYTLTGYTFQGWATEQGGTKVYNDGASVTFTESVTLYAVWQVNSHNVIFTPSITGATVKVNNSSNSAVSANYGTTVTIAVTPAAHYSLSNVSVSGVGGSVTVSGTGNTRTFTMPDENVTVTITMTEETKYTVNWYVAGTPTEETNYAGEALAGIAEPEIECNGKVFVGWTATANYAHDTDAPDDLFTDATTKTMPNNNTTNYYAVFAEETSSVAVATFDAANVTGLTESPSKTWTHDATGIKMQLVGSSSRYTGGTPNTWTMSHASGSKTVITAPTNITQIVLRSVYQYTSGNKKYNGWVNDASAGTLSPTTFTSAETDGYVTQTISGINSTTVTIQDNSSSAGNQARVITLTVTCGSTTYTGYTTSCKAPEEVTITFNANYGDTPDTKTQDVSYNSATALDANMFTRVGYSFAGWATSASGTKVYDDEQSVTLTKNTTLYALWTINNYNVTFSTPTGATAVTVNGQSDSPQSVEFGSIVTITITPDDAYAVSDVTVSGDVTPSGSGNNWSFTMPASDVTVTVNLSTKPTYTIRFLNNENVISTQTITQGQSAVKPSDPTPCDEGYTFVGWWTASLAEDNDEEKTWITDFTATQDQDYYAVFSYSDGEGGGSSDVVFNFGYSNDWGQNSSWSGTDRSSVTATKDGVTVTHTRGSGSMYANTTATRFYKDNTLTFTASEKTITSIVFTCSTYQTDITSDVGTCTATSSEFSWSGNASSVSFSRPSDASSYAQFSTATITISGGSTTYYTTAPTCSACDYKVTLTKGTETNGTFTLSKADGVYNNCSTDFVVTVSDINAADGYVFDHIEATGGSNVSLAGPDGSGNYTVTYAHDNSITSTITAVFEQIPTYTVTWSVNGDESAQTYYEGETITFEDPVADCYDKEFVGWSAEPVALTDVEPTFVTSATMGTNNLTYYAVFATATTTPGESSATLTKMGSNATFAENDNIVIVAKETTYALYQETVSNSYVKNWSFENDVTTVGADAKNYLTLTANNSDWYLGDDTNDYLYTSGSNNLAISSSRTAWTIAWNDNESAFTIVGNSRYLSCRTDLTGDNANKYRMGGATSGTPSGIIYFDIYKFVSGSSSTTTYSGYTSTCEYTRSFNNVDDYGTLCLPYGVAADNLIGAKAYSIVGKYMSGETITGIVLEEQTELEAGKPYVIQATATLLRAKYAYGVDIVDEPVDADGMVGNLSTEKLVVPANCYGLSNNQLRRVLAESVGKATVGQYKAYFNLLDENVPDAKEVAVTVAHRVMHTTDYEEVVTTVEEASGNPAAINWNEPVYNVLGQRVDRSATGVLIQGATKYIVITPIQ